MTLLPSVLVLMIRSAYHIYISFHFFLFVFCFCLSSGQFRNMLLRCSLTMLRTVQSTRLPTGKWDLGLKSSILDFNALQFTRAVMY